MRASKKNFNFFGPNATWLLADSDRSFTQYNKWLNDRVLEEQDPPTRSVTARRAEESAQWLSIVMKVVQPYTNRKKRLSTAKRRIG